MEPKQQVPYPLRMPAELRERLEKAAKKSDRSMNSEVVARLQLTFDPSAQADNEALLRKISHLEGQIAGAQAAFEFLVTSTTNRISDGAKLLEAAVSLASYYASAADDLLHVVDELYDGNVLDRKSIDWSIKAFKTFHHDSATTLAKLKAADEEFMATPLPSQLYSRDVTAATASKPPAKRRPAVKQKRTPS
jgi:hypothetical protein